MTLKGMRKADQQMILDTLGMDRAEGTTTTSTTATTTIAPLSSGLESGLGLTNTRWGWSLFFFSKHPPPARCLLTEVSLEVEHIQPSLAIWSCNVSTTYWPSLRPHHRIISYLSLFPQRNCVEDGEQHAHHDKQPSEALFPIMHK